MANIPAIVVTYHSSEVIGECIDSGRNAGLDIWVIDNSLDGSTLDTLKETDFDLNRYSRSTCNLGFGAAVNKGFEIVPMRDYTLLLNPDCFVSSQTIDSLLSLMAENPRVGAVSPRMINGEGRSIISGGPLPTIWKELLAASHLDGLVSPRLRIRLLTLRKSIRPRSTTASWGVSLVEGAPVDAAWASGFCLLVRSAVFEAVGGFDGRFFLYFEDVDLCKRIRDTGFGVMIDRRVAAVHLESTSTRAVGKNRYYRAGMFEYFNKNGSRFERAVARFAGLFGGDNRA